MIIPTAVENFAPLLHVDALPVVARELSRSARRQLDQLHLDQGLKVVSKINSTFTKMVINFS